VKHGTCFSSHQGIAILSCLAKYKSNTGLLEIGTQKNPVDFPIIKDMHNQSDHFGRRNPQFLEKSTCVKLLKSLDLLLRLVFAWWGGTYLGWAARVTSPQPGRDGTLLPFLGIIVIENCY
jgi:hypothetical protein